ncbi:hypothetical protein GmHk_14G040896 [Glycine max]|nr:hypothetical protein GmHk_14G040896 [Glycine max]
MELPTIATYPLAGGRRETQGCVIQRRKTCGSRHQCLFEENVRKTKKGSANFKNKGSRVVYMPERY